MLKLIYFQGQIAPDWLGLMIPNSGFLFGHKYYMLLDLAAVSF